MAKDDKGKISFDTGINLDGFDEDAKDLKSMAEDIAKSIEDMGKNVEKSVGNVNTKGTKKEIDSLSQESLRAAESIIKVQTAMDKMDDVNGPKAITAAIKEYEKELDALKEKMEDYSRLDIYERSDAYKKDKESMDELINSIKAAKADLRNYYMEQEAMKTAVADLKQARKDAAAQARQDEKEAAAAEKQSIARKKKLGTVIKMVGGQLGRMASKATGVSGAYNKMNNKAEALQKGFNKLTRMAKTVFLFGIIKKGLTALRTQLGSMLSANKEFSSSLSSIKGNLLVAFQPVYEAALPYINLLMSALKQLTNQIAAFTNTLFGKSVSASNAAAAALNKQAAAAKNVNKQTKLASASIDQFNILSSDTDSSSGVTFNADTDAGASSFAEKVKSSWENQDFTEVGQIIGRKITDTLDSIKWEGIQAKAAAVGKSFATLFNGMADGIDWNTVGSTISNGLNTALITVHNFVYNFDFLSFGQDIGNLLNSSINDFDWSLLGITLSEQLNGAFDWIFGFLSTFDWSKLGTSIATSINDFVHNTNWAELGMDFSMLVIGIVTSITDLLKETDWAAVVNSVFDVIKGIDWGGIIRSLIEFIVTWFLTSLELIWEAGKNIGEMLIDGLKGGITNVIDNIGNWIKENLIDPVVNTVKEFFGIHSPSTVFAEIGTYLMQGLINGISQMGANVRAKIGSVKDDILRPFNNLGLSLKNTFHDAWQKVLGVFTTTSFGKIASNIEGTFKNIINRLISGINNVVAKPFNTLGNIFSRMRNINILGGHPFGFLPDIETPQIPFLAKGAVIPANSPFVAVLGDQKNGKNIEAPESLIRQIMREELAGLTNQQKVEVLVNLKGEMAAFFKAFIEEYHKEKDRTGIDPLLGI